MPKLILKYKKPETPNCNSSTAAMTLRASPELHFSTVSIFAALIFLNSYFFAALIWYSAALPAS